MPRAKPLPNLTLGQRIKSSAIGRHFRGADIGNEMRRQHGEGEAEFGRRRASAMSKASSKRKQDAVVAGGQLYDAVSKKLSKKKELKYDMGQIAELTIRGSMSRRRKEKTEKAAPAPRPRQKSKQFQAFTKFGATVQRAQRTASKRREAGGGPVLR